MNLAVFRGRRFVRFEVNPGHLEPGSIRVPVTTPAQPLHVPERHYLWSTCRLNDDEQGATIHYSVHDREQVEVGSEAPQHVAESSPQTLRLIDDDTDMNQRIDDLNAAVADIAAANLRMQQELAEAQQVIGVLARVVCAAQVYSADGKPVTIGLPASQVQALQRAMERAA